MTSRKRAREVLEGMFRATLDERIDRFLRIKRHPIIPDHHYTPAFVECRELFVAGHYYGCISLAQSVAEALSRYIAEKSSVPPGKDLAVRFIDLRKKGIITEQVRDAFEAVWADDRNDFHHLNPAVETDRAKLETRVEQCLSALETIEAEIFAFAIERGAIVPKYPKYWPSATPGTVATFVGFEGA